MLLALSSLYWNVSAPSLAPSLASVASVTAPPAIVKAVVPAGVGSQANALARLRALVPQSWFKAPTPEVTGVLNGFAANEAFAYTLVRYARAQSRLETTTDGFLDIAAWDFFGGSFLRRQAESDASFAVRLIAELTRPRLTRAAISSALYNLTGNTPTILEPWNTGDCGALNTGTLALSGSSPGVVNGAGIGSLALSENNGCLYIPPQAASFSAGAGAVGSLVTPYQFFVTLARPAQPGVKNVAGLGSYGGGLWSPSISQGVGSFSLDSATDFDTSSALSGFVGFSLITPAQVQSAISDQNIYDTINATKAAGTTAWVNLTGSAVGAAITQTFDTNFDLNWG